MVAMIIHIMFLTHSNPLERFFFSLVRRDSVMLAARSQGYHEAIYGYVGGSDWDFIRGFVAPHGSRER
jgi:hypothetical protein